MSRAEDDLQRRLDAALQVLWKLFNEAHLELRERRQNGHDDIFVERVRNFTRARVLADMVDRGLVPERLCASEAFKNISPVALQAFFEAAPSHAEETEPGPMEAHTRQRYGLPGPPQKGDLDGS